MNLRRVAVGWLGLIVLYTAVTQSDKVAGLLGTTTTVTQHLSDPAVALIKNRAGAAAPATATTTTYTVPVTTGQTPTTTFVAA